MLGCVLLLLDFDDKGEYEDESLPEPSPAPALDLVILNFDTNELTLSRLVSLSFFFHFNRSNGV